MTYDDFLKTKDLERIESGFDVSREELNPALFPFQRDIVAWALKKGKAAIFSDCGTGKTIMQMSFADEVCKHTKGKALIIAPLAVVEQTKKEGAKFGIKIKVCREPQDIEEGVNITNYVFTPFLGIGSEIYQSVLNGRRGIGIELKPTYYKCAVENLKMAEKANKQVDLFEFIGG